MMNHRWLRNVFKSRDVMNGTSDSDRNGAAIPPMVPTKERFSLSRRDWVAYFGGAAVIVFTQPFQRTPPYPLERLVPYILGQLAALLIISFLAALLVFFLSKRSKNAASMTFMICVALGAVGQVGEVVRNGGRPTNDDAVLNRVTPTFLKWLKDQGVPYHEAREKMVERSPTRPGWLKERTDLVSARERIVRFREANGELRDLYGRMSRAIREELAAQGVREKDRSRLAKVIADQPAIAKTRSAFTALRDQDDAIAAELLKACDLLDESWDHWRFDAKTGTTVFEDVSANKAFNAIQTKVQQLGEEQERDRANTLRAIQRGGK
jgi:hypothetical protein